MTPKKKKKQQLLAQFEGHRLFAHCLNGLSPIKPSTPDQKNATAQPSKPHACVLKLIFVYAKKDTLQSDCISWNLFLSWS